MRKILSLFLIFVFVLSVSACGAQGDTSDNKNSAADTETFATNENAQLFSDKIIETKKLIDPIFTSVCSAWKAEENNEGSTVTDVNNAIKRAWGEHTESIASINEADKSISELYELAKKCPAASNVEAVMTAYKDYKDSVLKADASTNPDGYIDASLAKNSLDKALRNLRSVL